MLSWVWIICYVIWFGVEARSLGHHSSEQDGNLAVKRFTNTSSVLISPSEDCNTCIIDAPGGVSLVYWEPEDANEASPSDPVTAVEDGFTFTSPSVYVVYTSLKATYACDGGPVTTIGPAFDRKTLEYSSRFLAFGTLSSPGDRCNQNVIVDGFHTIDFSYLYDHPITTSTTTKAGCPPYVNPRLSMPAQLTDVDPAWSTCQPLHYGAFDPPRIFRRYGGQGGSGGGYGWRWKKSKRSPVAAPDPIVTPAASQTAYAFVDAAAASAPGVAQVPMLPLATTQVDSLVQTTTTGSTATRRPEVTAGPDSRLSKPSSFHA